MTERDVYLSAGDPVRIGLLVDLPGRYSDIALRVYDIVRDQVIASGGFERGVEFVVRKVQGPPAGRIKTVMDGYHELCDEGALLVVGANHSDSAIAITAHAEARKVPVIALGATGRNASTHVFSLGWGSAPDDGYIMTSWLVKHGHKRVTLTWDKAHHIEEYVHHFRTAAARAGIRILADERFSQIVSDDVKATITRTVDEHRRLAPDAIAHFGSGDVSYFWAKAVNDAKWDVPRVMNGSFSLGWFPQYAAGFEGWVGTTLWDEENKLQNEIMALYHKKHPEHPALPEIVAHYRDAMRTALEGLRLAPILTPDGLRQGLEEIRMLPAASGGPRTAISFGPHDHRAHKGMDVMVLRRCRKGVLVPEGRFEPVF